MMFAPLSLKTNKRIAPKHRRLSACFFVFEHLCCLPYVVQELGGEVGTIGPFNGVTSETIPHRLSKYCSISSGVRQEKVSPLAYSLRALLIFRDKAGEIWLSALTLAVRTEATPRISFMAFLRSAIIAFGSSVTIIWFGDGV